MKDLIQKINESGYKIYLTTTGRGARLLSDYLSVSGASKVFCGARIPYSVEELEEIYKGNVKKYVSEDAARVLAEYSLNKIDLPSLNRKGRLGVGITASLIKDNQRDGRINEAFICFRAFGKQRNLHLILKSDKREEQDRELSEYVVKQMADFLSLNKKRKPYVSALDIKATGYALFPGSFNPIHEGHLKIIERVRELGFRVALELTLKNADKIHHPSEVYDNHLLLAGSGVADAVFLTDLTFISDKIRHLEPAVIVMGLDTFNRVIRDKDRDENFENFVQASKIVFDREGETQENLKLYKNINFLPEVGDISSTKIRNKLDNKDFLR